MYKRQEYEQANPLLTNVDGKYAWDVPEGWWRVKCEKEGYQTRWSDWMTVPPVQTDINIAMHMICLLYTSSVEKNEQDVAVLQKIIATQSGKNTTISENLNDSKQYTWENGRLVGINWSDENNIYTGGRGMTGAISFAGLSALKQLNCSGNSITALDVSGNTALETLECFNTSITALDLSNNVLLKDLQCGYANLKELHVENNPALENLSCEGTYIYKLDVSKNKALKTLRCNNTGLTSLDLSPVSYTHLVRTFSLGAVSHDAGDFVEQYSDKIADK